MTSEPPLLNHVIDVLTSAGLVVISHPWLAPAACMPALDVEVPVRIVFKSIVCPESSPFAGGAVVDERLMEFIAWPASFPFVARAVRSSPGFDSVSCGTFTTSAYSLHAGAIHTYHWLR